MRAEDFPRCRDIHLGETCACLCSTATIRATTLGAGLLLTVFKVAVAAALVAVILLSQPGEEPVAVRPPDTSPLVHPVL